MRTKRTGVLLEATGKKDRTDFPVQTGQGDQGLANEHSGAVLVGEKKTQDNGWFGKRCRFGME